MIEREVENLLEQKLVEKNWIIEVGNPERQVYRQKPRTIDENIALKSNKNARFPDFILYEDTKSEKPIAIIETKKATYKNLEFAKQQGLYYAKKLSAKFLFLFNANRIIAYYVPTEENLYIDQVEVEDILPLKTLKQFQSNKLSLNEKAEIKSKTDLINVFKVANNKLREAGINAGIARFTEFSNLLFLKLVSELNDDRGYNISKNYLWEAYRNMENDVLLGYINNTVIPGLNSLFDSNEAQPLFTPLKIKNSLKLKEIVNKLDTVDLKKIDTDIKGDAFEYFIQKYNQTNNDLGEYFTPRHIVKFLNDIVKPEYGDKIYDPFCGTGGMLTVAFNHIYNELNIKGKLDEQTLSNLREQSIWGSEISDTSRIAKMNMILSGDGHSNIVQQDSFMNPVSSKFNVIISNIPFNMEVSESQAQLYTPYIKKGNSVAILHILKALKSNNPSSRAAVIVPDAVLNDSSMSPLREKIVKSGQLLGIVSLPSKVFMPYTEAKTSVLIFRSEAIVPNDDVFVFKVKNDGYTLTTRRRPLSGINDLDEFIAIHEQMLKDNYQTKKNHDNLYYVSRKEILSNKRKSLLLSQYHDELKKDHVRIKDVMERSKQKNIYRYPTASITNSEFWGMPLGEKLWGENFVSVTSHDNVEYSVVNQNEISFNPARANIGSFGINLSNRPLAVTAAYPVYKVKAQKLDDFLPEYIYLQIRHNAEVEEDIAERAYGTIRQSLSKDEFEKVQIPKLSLEKQKEVVEEVKRKYEKYSRLKEELNNLEF
ncbi:TPA: N-6 DNA methylase [Staphylococcus delphini]|nr:N-6 DNA methylase [Staphylococcus delphini]